MRVGGIIPSRILVFSHNGGWHFCKTPLFWRRFSTFQAKKKTEPINCTIQSTPQSYKTLQTRITAQLEVKRSKFIAHASPILSEQDAHSFLSQVSDPRATHNCWAYKLGDQYRFNDDGEPGGTAGKPIYSAIVASGLDGVMVVVIRYFGGIKLGTGGLVRAYGGVVSDCLRDAPTCEVKQKVQMALEVPYELLGNIYSILQSYQVHTLSHEYDESGSATNYMKFEIDFDGVDELEQSIKNSCHEKVTISRP